MNVSRFIQRVRSVRFRRVALSLAVSVAVISVVGGGLWPKHAAAASESYTFKDATTIVGERGDFTSTVSFKLKGDVYVGTYDSCKTCGNEWTISSVTKATNGYTANIKSTGTTVSGVEQGAITIVDTKGVGPGGGNLQNIDDEEKPVCEAADSQLVNLICPIYNGLANMSDWFLQDIIVPFVRPSPVGLNPNDKATSATFTIWSTFRVYGNIILVILLLVAIIGQTINGGVMEAYTARKMLPRILLAGVLINVSIYLVAFAVDLSSVIGNGIADLITAPLVQTGQFKFNPGTTQIIAINSIGATLVAMTAFLVTGTATAFVPVILLFVVLPAFLALLGAFVTLILLQALIMALIISSPVALALYCLPNTEKYFHTWWDWLLRALLVYPIFMTIIAISDVFTVTIQRANGIGN